MLICAWGRVMACEPRLHCLALVRVAVHGDDRIRHQLLCDGADEVVGHVQLLGDGQNLFRVLGGDLKVRKFYSHWSILALMRWILRKVDGGRRGGLRELGDANEDGVAGLLSSWTLHLEKSTIRLDCEYLAFFYSLGDSDSVRPKNEAVPGLTIWWAADWNT